MPPVNKTVNTSLTDIKVDTVGVEKLLLKIKPHKACGPDELPNMVLSKCAKSLAPGISTLFQKSLDSGILPKCVGYPPSRQTARLQNSKDDTGNKIPA